jgi:hypothetical protein
MAVTIDGTNGSLFNANGSIGIGGANYGTSGQVLTSAGSGAAPTWATVSAGAGTVRAWVNWTMSGSTVTVRASGNVSSVTRSGSGTFNIAFTTALSSTYYCANVTGQRPTANNACIGAIQQGTTPSTTTLSVAFTEDSASGIDPTIACVQVVL